MGKRYGALMGQAEAYLKSLEAQSRGGTGGDTRLSLARETVSDLEGCLEASEETVSIITDTLSRLSESVDTASDLAVALERAATFASRNSVLRRSTSPFSRAAVRALAADVQSLPGAVASGVRTVPERMATGWDDLSSDGRTLTVASRIALSVLLLLSLALVLRWLRAGLPRWFEAAPERNEGEEGTGAWRARHTYAVLSLSAICVTLLVLAKLWWELRDLRHAVLLLCLLLGYAGYGHLLKLLLHPDSPHRLLLADEAEMGLPFRFGRALGIANLILMPIEVSLAVIGYENVEALHVIYLIHALALLALAAIYVPRVRRMVHTRFLGRIPAVRLLGEADVFLVITLVLFVILSAAGYTRLAVLVFRGVLLSGISFYGVYILGRRTGRWLMKRHPALGEAAAQETDKPDDTLALRSVGWDLIIILQRLAIAAIGAVLIAFSWGLKEPHVEFAQTLLARNIMEVQGMEISVWALLRAAIVAYVIYLIARMVRSLIAGSSRLEERYGAGARYAAAHLWFYTAVSVGFVWALLAAGFQWSILTVFAGMAGIGLGFGLQDVVKNFISGLIILVERPMRVGDLIDVEGESGYVDDISLRSTTLRGTDNVHVIIPNSAFVDQTIRNFSIRDRRMRLRVEVGVAYGSDLDLVREAMLKVARAHPDTLEKPDAEVFLTGFGDSSIDFLLMAWIARPHPLVQLRVRSQLMCGIADEFRRLGIEIPFPQRDLNVRSSEPVPVVLLEGGYDLGSYPQDPPQPDENRPDDHAADSGEAS